MHDCTTVPSSVKNLLVCLKRKRSKFGEMQRGDQMNCRLCGIITLFTYVTYKGVGSELSTNPKEGFSSQKNCILNNSPEFWCTAVRAGEFEASSQQGVNMNAMNPREGSIILPCVGDEFCSFDTEIFRVLRNKYTPLTSRRKRSGTWLKREKSSCGLLPVVQTSNMTYCVTDVQENIGQINHPSISLILYSCQACVDHELCSFEPEFFARRYILNWEPFGLLPDTAVATTKIDLFGEGSTLQPPFLLQSSKIRYSISVCSRDSRTKISTQFQTTPWPLLVQMFSPCYSLPASRRDVETCGRITS